MKKKQIKKIKQKIKGKLAALEQLVEGAEINSDITIDALIYSINELILDLIQKLGEGNMDIRDISNTMRVLANTAKDLQTIQLVKSAKSLGNTDIKITIPGFDPDDVLVDCGDDNDD